MSGVICHYIDAVATFWPTQRNYLQYTILKNPLAAKFQVH